MFCLFCNSQKIKLYFDYGRFIGEPYKLVQCADCELVQTEPKPSNEFLKNWYQNYDSLGERDSYYRSFQETDPYSTEDGREIVDKFNLLKSIINDNSGVNVLEVGSGAGLFLNLVKKNGWTPFGVEINSKAANASIERFGLEIWNGTIDNFVSDKKLDAIVLWDILEHVENPVALIKKIKEFLKPNGFVFVETPNSSSLLDKCVIFLSKLKINQPAATFYGLHHLTLWNKNNLKKLLEDNNLKAYKMIDHSTSGRRIFRSNSFKDALACSAISCVQFFGKIFGMQNKMIVVARNGT